MTSHIISTLPREKTTDLMEDVCCSSVEKDGFSGMKLSWGSRHGAYQKQVSVKTFQELAKTYLVTPQ